MNQGESDTWIFPGTPVLSILLATLTVFPQMSYWGRRAPITPATTGPTLIPVQTGNIQILNKYQTKVNWGHSRTLCVCVNSLINGWTYPLSRQTHYTTGSWFHPKRQTSLWHSLLLYSDGRTQIFWPTEGKQIKQLVSMYKIVLHIVFSLMCYIYLYMYKHAQKHKKDMSPWYQW